MKKFLIDENLPIKLDFIEEDHYRHVRSIGSRMSDYQILDFAERNKMTILTQDSDFYKMIDYSKPLPKLIHLKTGNMRLKEFMLFMKINWPQISKLSDEHRLVTIYRDRVEYFD